MEKHGFVKRAEKRSRQCFKKEQLRRVGRGGRGIYCSKEEFEGYIKDGEMLEYTEYGGNYYGTPASEIERIFGDGKTPFLILDINGVISFKEMKDRFPSFSVYLTAPLPVLEERLYAFSIKSVVFLTPMI